MFRSFLTLPFTGFKHAIAHNRSLNKFLGASNFRRFSYTTTQLSRALEIRSFQELQDYYDQADDRLAIFEFYDDSQGVCKLQSARLESKVDNADEENLDLVRVDVLTSVDLANYFEIETVPTLITFFHCETVERKEGTCTDEELQNLIDHLIDRHHQTLE
ncbi:Thioredoxin [Aphelenchoides besseyi]|nr:Thioredoxin [Aphelenchoides besseyi]KAI6235555.1 Thioredoxin [Aphelenchoides besseyi]